MCERFGMMLRWLASYILIKKGTTIFIHIGKCGGSTVTSVINKIYKNSDIRFIHIKKPVYRKDLKYIIVARNPISRLLSAFRFRFNYVLSKNTQKESEINRFKGEYDVLAKYGCLNNLAEALYHKDGTPNKITQTEIRKIHHIKEDINFYLGDLLKRCKPEQIKAVLMQENLNNDILRVFGYKNDLRKNVNQTSNKNSELSSSSIKNLKKFFIKDYLVLTKLYCYGKIDKEVFQKVI